jgi:hypothetical protein
MRSSHFKKAPSKEEQRRALEHQVASFLSKGGRIEQVKPGETALDNRKPPLRTPLFDQPRADRTPLLDVVKELDARRANRLKRKPVVKRTRKPTQRKKVIYDDFGEALRTVWSD